MKGIFNSRSLLLRTIGNRKNMTDLENQHMKEDQIKAQSIYLSFYLTSFIIAYPALIGPLHSEHTSTQPTQIPPKHITCCFHSMPSTFTEF